MSGVPGGAGGAEGSDLPVFPGAPGVLSAPGDLSTAGTRSIPRAPAIPGAPHHAVPSRVPCARQCPQCPHLGTGSPPQHPGRRHQAQGPPDSPQQHQPVSSGAGGALPGPQGPLVPCCWAGQRRAWGETGLSGRPGGSRGSLGGPGGYLGGSAGGHSRDSGGVSPAAPSGAAPASPAAATRSPSPAGHSPGGPGGMSQEPPRGTPNPF